MLAREKHPYVIISFDTTAAAFQLERCARSSGFTGRLIPVPRALSAGCGFAWRDLPACEQALTALLHEKQIAYNHICVISL